jgi:hypothetical protein
MEGAMLSFSQRPNFTVVQRSLMAERGVKQRSRSMDGRVYIWFEQA